MTDYRIIPGDVLDGLRSLPDGYVQTCVTSPPYWGLRDYGAEGQIGLEPTPAEYLAKMVEVFREVRRCLRDDGTAWVNMGDGYANNGNGGGSVFDNGRTDGRPGDGGRDTLAEARRATRSVTVPDGLKPKDLIGMPWRLAFALQADGWYLRSDIIWSKPNPMPESVTDRPTKAHEYIFLLSKQPRYYFDAEAVKEPAEKEPHARGGVHEPLGGPMDRNGHSQYDAAQQDRVWAASGTRNIRTVWTIPTQAYPEAHFATYPEKLIEPCILAGTSAKGCCPKCGKGWEREVELVGGRTTGRTPERQAAAERAGKPNGANYGSGLASEDIATHKTVGWSPACKCNAGEPVPCTVLDPFTGSGTTAVVALRHGRRFIGCELNPEYITLAHRRIGESLRPATFRDESKETDDAPLFTGDAK